MIPLFSIPSIHRNVERQQKVRFQMIRALTRGIRSRKIRISRTEEQRVHLQHEMADVIWMIKPYDSSVGDYRFFNEDEKKQIIEAVGKKVGEKNSDFFYGGDHFNVFHENEEVFTAFVDVAQKIIKNATVEPVFSLWEITENTPRFLFSSLLSDDDEQDLEAYNASYL